MFFLNLGNITNIARICLVPSIVFCVFARGFLLMVLSLLLVLVCIVFSLIHAPSDKKVLEMIDKSFSEFKNEMQQKAKETPVSDIKILMGYKNNNRFKLKRKIGNDFIYPTLLFLAVVKNRDDNRRMIYICEQSIISKKKPYRETREIDLSKLKINVQDVPKDDYAVFLDIDLGIAIERISAIVKKNYHYREFVNIALGENN